ncbi:hypothetical protein C8R43DRAFT_1208781 [Mycena crocata]|nr:hypothetical protein C8R43DRAFT_1208781 [Mycena crocata]
MFEEAANISQREIKAYRKFAFTSALAESTHDPFFSVENATQWITSLGYQLYLEHDDSEVSQSSWTPDEASMAQLKHFRYYMVSDEYLGHPFFSLEHTDRWINLVAFEAYMTANHGSFEQYRSKNSSPFGSRAPSRAASTISLAGSCASSRVSSVPSSRASSPASSMLSRPSSAMSVNSVITDPFNEDSVNNSPALGILPEIESVPTRQESIPAAPSGSSPKQITSSKSKRKRKGKASQQIRITRQLSVDEMVKITVVPRTWTVPHTSTAYLVDLSESPDVLKTSSGKVVSLDTFIREEDQESWRGSTGNLNGDVNVRGLTADPDEEVRCRRCHFYCNGVKTCELIDPTLFSECERYEPDDEAMRALWNHELDANEREAGSASGIISRFYNRVKQSKCKIKCDGVPVLIGLRTPSVYAKSLFVGCSKWTRAEKYQHRYTLIPANVNENTFRFVLENDGLLPSGGPTSLNERCVLTVHPRVALSNCPYSHIIDGRIQTPAMIPRPCPTEMIIMIPVADESASLQKAIVVLRSAHNHPAHPHTKPSSDDRTKLETAVQAAGLTGLTVKKLLHASSTAIVYNGERLAESSPAFASRRKVRDFITEQKKKEHPFGLDWEGVQHELNTREAHLAKQDRYIHTAMSKNGFRLVVTMHPQIAMFIHLVLSLSIDYTFKRVKGKMNEWEVASLLDRVNYRLTFASLYCDAQTKEGFAQLFTELFDTIFSVTGERLKISPFFPDAKCRKGV